MCTRPFRFDWDEATHTLTIGDRKGTFPGMLETRSFHIVIRALGPRLGHRLDRTGLTRLVQYAGKSIAVTPSGLRCGGGDKLPAMRLLRFAYRFVRRRLRLARNALYRMPDGVESRWASPENPKGERASGGKENAGRKGRPMVQFKAGEQLVLAEVAGTSGTVRRIWVTISDRSPRCFAACASTCSGMALSTPAVSAPFGDFFGVGLGRTASFESALFANPEGRSFNCYVPMPFRTGHEDRGHE